MRYYVYEQGRKRPTKGGLDALGEFVALGASGPLTRLADGSTIAGREIYAALVSKATYDLHADLGDVLSGDLSRVRVLFRPPIFIPQTAQQRLFLMNARKQLLDEFLPAALTAIRDYSRSLSSVQATVDSYFNTVVAQVRVATSSEAATSLVGFWRNVSKEAARMAVEATSASAQQVAQLVATAAASAAAEASRQASKNIYFALLLLGLGVGAAVYLGRSYKEITA